MFYNEVIYLNRSRVHTVRFILLLIILYITLSLLGAGNPKP